MTKVRSKQSEKTNKQGFLQGVITLMFSQVLIKLLGMVYTLYLTNREGFGDKGNGIVSNICNAVDNIINRSAKCNIKTSIRKGSNRRP